MRKRSILIITLLFSFTVGAEKLIFSNNDEEVNITGDVVIDNQSGDVTVTTENGSFLIVPENQPVILGFFPDEYDITIGESVGVSWVVANADTCNASTVGNNSTWEGNRTATDGKNPPSPEVVLFDNLPATLQLECSNGLSSVTESFTISEQQGVISTDPSIDSFTVNGSSATSVVVTGPGATATIAWSASDVSTCAASSNPTLLGWNSASIGTNGTTSPLSITETTTVSLDCDNLPVQTRTIIFQTQVDPACASTVLPNNLTEGPVQTDYTLLNDGFPFGTNDDTNAIADFNVTQYMEISGFSTSQTNFRRKLQFFPTPSNFNSPFATTMSISRCPGDFNPSTAICTRLFVTTQFPQVRISTNPSDDPNTFCVIQPGQSYYLNFLHDNDPFDQTPGRCGFQTDSRCAVFFNELEDQ
ncbi:hypothetical protein OS175_02030 [Marinicella sp. S1101]|uniref:hypothetical protein n=1 Tax=Marinicella marina TaxID=2996016 RepID=UPI0022608B54|nr:hypothetical protein [Marinicella marina]MCX7552643.1 hypothetical protein [Marinicella marina]MDJ1139519.1 hypothetical protein [Marinicella marina]